MNKEQIIARIKALREEEDKIDKDIQKILEDVKAIKVHHEEKKKFF